MSRRISCKSPISCRYLHYRLPNGRTILLPMIHVKLVSEKETFTTTGLLDSGATDTFIPYEMAEILDVIPEERSNIPVETAGGGAQFFPVRLKRISLLTRGAIFSDFPKILALVPSTPERDLPYVVLGRDSVFRRFHITFRENIRKITLEHHKWVQKKSR